MQQRCADGTTHHGGAYITDGLKGCCTRAHDVCAFQCWTHERNSHRTDGGFRAPSRDGLGTEIRAALCSKTHERPPSWSWSLTRKKEEFRTSRRGKSRNVRALPLSRVSGWTTVAMTAVYWRLRRGEELQHHRERRRGGEGGWEWFHLLHPPHHLPLMIPVHLKMSAFICVVSEQELIYSIVLLIICLFTKWVL